LSRYSNKIESVGLRKWPYYRYLIEKVTSTDARITNISQSLPHKMAETVDMKKLRHCLPMYRRSWRLYLAVFKRMINTYCTQHTVYRMVWHDTNRCISTGQRRLHNQWHNPCTGIDQCVFRS